MHPAPHGDNHAHAHPPTHAHPSRGAKTPRVIAVTGGAGFVGRHLVRELIDRGHTCRVLTRDPARAEMALPRSAPTSVGSHADPDRPTLEIIAGSIDDESAVADLVRGADAAVHLIGIIRQAPGGQTFDRMHPGATRAIVRACEAAGVRRLLHMSALGVGPEGPSAYQKSKFEAERVVRGSSLDWTIFRPGLIHGPDGEFFGMVRAWCEGRAAPFLFLPYFLRVEFEGAPGPFNPPRLVAPTVAPVHVDDVARAFADALERPGSIGEVIPLCGPELIRFPDMLRLVRDVLPQAKKELRPLGLPGALAAVQAWAFGLIGMGSALPFDAGMALMGQSDSWCPLDRARSILGFDPRPFEPSLRAYAAGPA